ncbi:MAG: hypothetical protein ABI175_11020, partial [Polyangiales bacterium]
MTTTTTTTSSAPRPSALDEDRALRKERLGLFLRWMLPIAVGFALLYAGTAVYLHSGRLAIACLDVVGFFVVLLFARRRLAHGALETAVELVAYGLFAMCVVAAPIIPWLRAPMIVIPLAGVALALPDLEGAPLRRMSWAAFVSEVIILAVSTWQQPHDAGPPMWLRNTVIISATTLSVGLTFLLLYQDANRLRKSIATADFHALQVRAAVERVPIVIFAVNERAEFTLSEGHGLASFGLAPGALVGQNAYTRYASVDWLVNAI